LNDRRAEYAIAVDIGGTFTDVTLADLQSGQLWQVKTPTTPGDQSEAFARGIRRVLAEAGVSSSAVGGVFHGTTVATNAILEHKGARVGLLTTEGCRYVLHIGRHDVPKDAHMYTWLKPARLVLPRLIFEVTERLGPDGSLVRELDEEQCRRALRALAGAAVESLAVCFLHAHASSVHEQRARELAAEELPAVPVSLSSEVLPVFREYERTTATVVNAYVLPQVARYHRRLEDRLSGLGVTAPLRIMKSNGGMYGAREAATRPIHTILSGPAAGVIGAILVGAAANQRNVISIDVGGTSADICLSRRGQPEVTVEGQIAGLPLTVPMVGVQTIGAGGGSLARLSPSGSLLVGPQSAGAEPGPACYGRGGAEPTVTDAHLVLGRIPPDLADGGVRLDVKLAGDAIAERIAEPLALTLHEAADGIVEILNNNMAAAIRAVSVERGYDPREFALVAGGGAGPLHGGRLAELLGIPLVIVPESAGLLSTLGLLATDLRNDYVQTRVQRAGQYDLADLNAGLADLEREATAWLEREGVDRERCALARGADMRYANQGYEITVPLDNGRLDGAGLEQLLERFHCEHERLYTWCSARLPVELINLRVTAYGRLSTLRLRPHGVSHEASGPAGKRPVYWGGRAGVAETPVYHFADLLSGWTTTGPAVVEQRFSTVLILPGHTARLDDYGNILVEVPR